MNAKTQIEKLLLEAGLTVNGPHDYDPQVFNEKLYQRVLSGGSLALGEAYIDGWWDAKDLATFFYKVLLAHLDQQFTFSWPAFLLMVKFAFFNLQSASRSFIVGSHHYDIGNDLYEAMLGKTMAYSCGYWKGVKTLDKAQEAKFDLICKKLSLKKGDYILDIGSGWGGFLKYAAKKYGVKGLGVTVSAEQLNFAKESCKGLPIEFKLLDYRSLTGKFDHIVSVGMFEHVGLKNYRVFMEKAKELLKDDGLFLLHTIGAGGKGGAEPFIEKYVFPNGRLPCAAEIATSVHDLFVMEDWHNFGAYYDKTLLVWFENFNKHWPTLKTLRLSSGQAKYSERFYRMWKYYLLSLAGSFRSRNNELWQIVLSKNGVSGGYESIR